MYVKFVKDDKTIEEVSISSEMIPFPYPGPANHLDRTSSRV